MFEWLRPPQVDDEYERVAYQSLHYALQVLIVITTIIALPAQTIVHIVLGPLGIGLFIYCYYLLQRGMLQRSGTIFLSAFWLLITAAATTLNGIHNVSIFFYVVIIVYANIVYTRRRYVLFITGASIASVFLLALGDVAGIVPLQKTEPIFIDRVGIATLIFSTTGILLAMASKALRRSLMRVQQNEKTLQERNLELQASEERYRLLFENATMNALVYDQDGRVVIGNETVAKTLAKDASALAGLTLADLNFPEQAVRLQVLHQQVLETGELSLTEGRTTLTDGTSVDYVHQIIPLPRSQVLALTTNVTGQKQAIRRQQELEEAQNRIGFFTEFFRTVSHDIKTPLTVLDTSLYLLQRDPDSDSRQKRIERLQRQVAILQNYIQDMLMVSRLEHIPTLEIRPINVESLIADVIRDFQSRLEKQAISIETTHHHRPLTINADEDHIRRVVVNLVENAVNYTPIGGSIFISSEQDNGTAKITVQDTGIGIASEDLPHLFEPFYRAEAAKTKVTTGTGLGLAIVKRIVDLHQGQITVHSTPPKGSIFTLTMPV